MTNERSERAARLSVLPELRQFQRLRRPEPDHVVGVILQRVASLRVGEHRQAAAVQHQPGHHVGELLLADGELAAAARVRADRIVMHPPDLDAEFFAGGFAKLQRLRTGRRVVIDVGVEVLDLAHVTSLYSAATDLLRSKKRFSGRGNPRFSRKVLPSYSRRNRPRRCSSGMTPRTKSSRPPGRYGNMMVKPSLARVSIHSSISSAMVFGVPTMANPEEPPMRWASWRTVRLSRFAAAIARSRPLLLALLSGISGSGPSGSNFEASVPSAIESEAMELA